jgi:hypothetical protein
VKAVGICGAEDLGPKPSMKLDLQGEKLIQWKHGWLQR